MGKISRSPFKGKPSKGTGDNTKSGKTAAGAKTVIRNNTKNK